MARLVRTERMLGRRRCRLRGPIQVCRRSRRSDLRGHFTTNGLRAGNPLRGTSRFLGGCRLTAISESDRGQVVDQSPPQAGLGRGLLSQALLGDRTDETNQQPQCTTDETRSRSIHRIGASVPMANVIALVPFFGICQCGTQSKLPILAIVPIKPATTASETGTRLRSNEPDCAEGAV